MTVAVTSATSRVPDVRTFHCACSQDSARESEQGSEGKACITSGHDTQSWRLAGNIRGNEDGDVWIAGQRQREHCRLAGEHDACNTIWRRKRLIARHGVRRGSRGRPKPVGNPTARFESTRQIAAFDGQTRGTETEKRDVVGRRRTRAWHLRWCIVGGIRIWYRTCTRSRVAIRCANVVTAIAC